MKIYFLGFAASLLFATIISHQVLTTSILFNHNISITLSESDAEMIINAKFPSSRSPEVNALLIRHFKLNDTLDLKSTEIFAEPIPGQTMDFKIQSKPGRVKIIMLKSKNTLTVVSQLKDFGEQLKGVLTL